MQHAINRYTLKKEFISTGLLIVTEKENSTNLTFKDSMIEESANELYHPMLALANLRRILEEKYESIIACNGCRIDTDHRATGGYGAYLISFGKPATESINIFEPTNQIDKLCTVEEHEIAYQKWIDSVMK